MRNANQTKLSTQTLFHADFHSVSHVFSLFFFFAYTRPLALSQFNACRITIPICCFCSLLLLLLLVHISSWQNLKKRFSCYRIEKFPFFTERFARSQFSLSRSFSPFFFAYLPSMCCFFGGVVVIVVFVPFFIADYTIVKSSFRKKNDIKQPILEREQEQEQNLMLQKKAVWLAHYVYKVKDLQATKETRTKKSFFPFLARSLARLLCTAECKSHSLIIASRNLRCIYDRTGTNTHTHIQTDPCTMCLSAQKYAQKYISK